MEATRSTPSANRSMVRGRLAEYAARVKRRTKALLFIASLLLAGFVTSIGLAWTPIEWRWPTYSTSTPPLGAAWSQSVREVSLNDTFYIRTFRPALGETASPLLPDNPAALSREIRETAYDVTSWSNGTVIETDECMFSVRLSGLPLRCVWMWEADVQSNRGMLAAFRNPENRPATSGVQVPWSTSQRLPITPIWTGLVANTVVWACVWCGLLFGVRSGWRRFTLRTAASRRARGLCPDCGYPRPVDVSVPCPECGRPSAPAITM